MSVRVWDDSAGKGVYGVTRCLGIRAIWCVLCVCACVHVCVEVSLARQPFHFRFGGKGTSGHFRQVLVARWNAIIT